MKIVLCDGRSMKLTLPATSSNQNVAQLSYLYKQTVNSKKVRQKTDALAGKLQGDIPRLPKHLLSSCKLTMPACQGRDSAIYTRGLHWFYNYLC